MSEAFPQSAMSPVYGVCHYLARVGFDMFFRGTIRGVENLPRSGAFLIATNHASMLDPFLVGIHVPRQMNFFARKTLWAGGFASWWLTAVGTIPVDRDGGQDVSALKRVLKVLAAGRVTILFPEGTRTTDGRLQPAKPGVGFMACRTGVPVVPARIFGSYEAFGRGTRFPRLGTPVSVVFGKPLLPSDYDNDAGKERYQVASDRIMAAIGALREPADVVI